MASTKNKMSPKYAGRLGGLKGGKARAEALTPEARRAIAKKAAAIRWGKAYDEMAYTLFTKKNTRVITESRVTLNRQGTFRLNGLAYEQMGRPRFVKFAYDAESKQIALLPGTAKDRHAYRVNSRNSGHMVYGLAFCHHVGLDMSVRWVWEGVWNGEMLELAVVSE